MNNFNMNTVEDDNKEFFDDDERSRVIKELTDPEEVDAAIELLKEELDASFEDNASEKPEPQDTSDEKKTETDNSGESREKTQEKFDKEESSNASEKKGSDETQDSGKEPFKITEEFIKNQPEENKKLLSNFAGKGKEDLAKAVANAVAMKNPFLKENAEAISAIAKKLEGYSDDDIVKTFIETQRETGKQESDRQEIPKEETKKVELPSIPEDDPKVQGILNQEVIKRLKKKYPNMPEDMDSEEYKEWERDLQDEGLRKSERFLSDLRSTESSVKNELQKVIYAQNNLTNLFNNSPEEILPLLTDDNLSKLKNINDNYRSINNTALQKEADLIKAELSKLNITEGDLGIDLSLSPDSSGSLYNETLNNLMYNGSDVDSNIVGRVGKVPILKKGQLAKKFIFENNTAILNRLVDNRAKEANAKVERLKEENLNTLGAKNTTGSKSVIQADDISKETDPMRLDKMLADIRSQI